MFARILAADGNPSTVLHCSSVDVDLSVFDIVLNLHSLFSAFDLERLMPA